MQSVTLHADWKSTLPAYNVTDCIASATSFRCFLSFSFIIFPGLSPIGRRLDDHKPFKADDYCMDQDLLSKKWILLLLWLMFPADVSENAIFLKKSGLGTLEIAKMRPRKKSYWWCDFFHKNRKNHILKKCMFSNFFFQISVILVFFSLFFTFFAPEIPLLYRKVFSFF